MVGHYIVSVRNGKRAFVVHTHIKRISNTVAIGKILYCGVCRKFLLLRCPFLTMNSPVFGVNYRFIIL